MEGLQIRFIFIFSAVCCLLKPLFCFLCSVVFLIEVFIVCLFFFPGFRGVLFCLVGLTRSFIRVLMDFMLIILVSKV